jgi:hypothetical protein
VYRTAYEVRRSERATRASRSRLLHSHSMQPKLHSSLPCLPAVAVPLAAISIAARLELPRSLGMRCSDRLRDRCKVDPAVPATLRDSTRVSSNSLRGPKAPIGSTETDLPPPERTCLQDLDISPKHVALATEERVCFPQTSEKRFQVPPRKHLTLQSDDLPPHNQRLLDNPLS